MEYKRLGEVEYRFISLIWDNEPIGSMKLVELADKAFGWKKSTTFTMLKRLIDKGLVQNVGSVVSSAVPREQVQRRESQSFIENNFGGSLPGFLVSFFGGKQISETEAEELKRLIDKHRAVQG